MNNGVQQLADVDAFVRSIQHKQADYFTAQKPISLSRAPGRLDVIGGIGDYSGCLVLEMPLANATLCAAQARDDQRIRIRSLDPTDADICLAAEFDLAVFIDGDLSSIAAAYAYFKQAPDLHWAAYIAGVLVVLQENCGVQLKHGVDMLLCSRVPLGKGVSSSAALEVASMQALCDIYQHPLDAVSLAIHCQEVENQVVGAPCGLMDQMASATGESHQLMRMHCQPADVQGHVAIPDHLAVWGIDSGIRHAVGGSDYGSVRIATFMGYRIIADVCHYKVTQDGAYVHIDDPRWNGYLANVSVEEWETKFRDLVPEHIKGADFIAAYGGSHDRVTQIDPECIYHVRSATAHPIYEQARVEQFAELLAASPSEDQMITLGQIMYQAHDSYSMNGLGSDGTDLLVDLVKQAGPRAGLYGAKISGGGSGGTVVILGRADAGDAVMDVMQRYAEQSEREPELFSSSSPGAAAFGIIHFQIDS